MDARNKFTPGPWAAYGRVDGRISIKAGEACLIAVVAKQPAAWEANAALIAAAPELLEALIDVKMLLNGDATNFDMLRDDVLNHASRLIAKATGGAE